MPHPAPRAAALLPAACLAALLASLLPATAGAQSDAREFRPEAASPVDPKLEALLERFREAQRTTKTMTATFKQVKEDELFAQPSVQTGRFSFTHPGNFRWDYLEPDQVTVLATRDMVQRWVPSEKLLQQTDISKNRRRLFNYFGIGSDVENLRRHFDIQLTTSAEFPDADELELRGKRRRVQKRIELLEMWIDRATSLPRAVRVVMADGSSTTWEFQDMRLNQELPADTYVLNVPPGTKVQSTDGRSDQIVDAIVEDEEEAGPHPSGQ